MMIHYIVTNKEVQIPYQWHPSAFTHCNIYKPKTPKPEEKYVYPTMFDHVEMCKKWLEKPTTRRHPVGKGIGKRKDRNYITPIIVDAC
mmetsp:Transcript_1407/g.1511  ORF Transcript_1407/g.1511 Transcript_1407/m.1511 type:complete len:88 (-) Transcript_1407:15-278(-)